MSDFMERRKAWNQAVSRTVIAYLNGHNDPNFSLYDAAATKIPPKKSYSAYHIDIMISILRNNISTRARNQQTDKTNQDVLTIMNWLRQGSSTDAGWVHFNSPGFTFRLNWRCYICCSLDQTGKMLNLLFNTFKRRNMLIPYFKVASHDEAINRNDTIVAWFSDYSTAQLWANTAMSSPVIWREGIAPPGRMYWKNTVSIDIEDSMTTTSRVADAAYDILEQQ